MVVYNIATTALSSKQQQYKDLEIQLLETISAWNSLLSSSKSLYLTTNSLEENLATWQNQILNMQSGLAGFIEQAGIITGKDRIIMESLDSLKARIDPGLELLGQLGSEIDAYLETEQGKIYVAQRRSINDVFAYQLNLSQIDDTWISVQKIKELVRFIDLFGGDFEPAQKDLRHKITFRINDLQTQSQHIWWTITFMLFLLTLIFLWQIARINQELKADVDMQTEHLQNTIDELNSTQEYLIESRRQVAVSNLVLGLTHQLNTPLGIAVTTSSALRTWTLDISEKFQGKTLSLQEAQNFNSRILQASDILEKNLDKMSSQINWFKKLSLTQEEYAFENLDLNAWFQPFLENMAQDAQRKQIRFSWHFHGKTLVRTSPVALSQILNQLYDNASFHGFSLAANPENQAATASSFSKDKVPSISLDFSLTENKNLHITFTDNGLGIETPLQGRVFDPFFTTANHKGRMGLGLHITRNLVIQKLKGSIRFSSVPGKTVFEISIPAEPL